MMQRHMQDATAAATARLNMLAAVAHARGFAARLAPCLHAFCGDLAIVDLAQDAPALTAGLQLLLQVLCDEDVRLSFPDTKDVCNALLATLPRSPVDTATQLPSAGSIGSYSPSAERLRCHVLALQGILAALSAARGTSAPWLALHCTVLQHASSALLCMRGEARCAAVDAVLDSAPAAACSAAQVASTPLGLLAQLCSCILATHDAQLHSCTSYIAAPQRAQTAGQTSIGSIDSLLSLLSTCATELLFLHAVEGAQQLHGAVHTATTQDLHATWQPHDASQLAAWQALADVVYLAVTQERAATQAPLLKVQRAAQSSVARGALRELVPCARLACLAARNLDLIPDSTALEA